MVDGDGLVRWIGFSCRCILECGCNDHEMRCVKQVFTMACAESLKVKSCDLTRQHIERGRRGCTSQQRGQRLTKDISRTQIYVYHDPSEQIEG